MKREGSPFQGVMTVALKEAADHMMSARMHIIMLLVILTAVGAVYGAIDRIRETTAEDPFLFLKLFTVAKEPVPSFASFLGFLLPLVAIALGFDSINGEYGRRTMSRLLAQPIYRDALLFGKFMGGLLVIGIALLVLWLLMLGMGILRLGLPPSAPELVRSIAYLVATLFYAGVWLALAMAFSTFIRSTATSALVALAIWLILSLFWGMLSPLVAGVLSPVDPTILCRFSPTSRPSRRLADYRRRPSMERYLPCFWIRPRGLSGHCSWISCRVRLLARRCRRSTAC